MLEYLKIDPAKTKLTLIMNTTDSHFGTKDIIKIESEEEAETIDLDVLSQRWHAPQPSALCAAVKS